MDIFEHKIFKPLFIALVAYFIFFVFYDLNWGSPFYFHPDERNIASSVSQLNLFSNLNPHFFAYGALPIYLVYFLGIVVNFLLKHQLIFNVQFDQAIIILRVVSAILTLGLTLLIYKVTVELADRRAAYLALIFSLTSTAFFQFSHFGTYEAWLDFFSLLAAYFFSHKRFVVGSSLLGMLCALKLSSLVLVIIPLYIIFTQHKNFKITIANFLTFIYFFVIFYIISAPFNIIDHKAFLDSMKYEAGVATGSLPVFYSGAFYNAAPIIFQYEKILPFLINPLLTLLSIPAIVYSIFLFIKKRDHTFGVFVISFLVLFISGSFLFAKWTRYIVPSIPFLYILIAVFLEKITFNKKYAKSILIFFIVTGLIFSFSYIKTLRIDQDTRISALDFAKKNISPDAKIISEVYDLGIVPFNSTYHNITLFNFYDLDNGLEGFELSNLLKSTDYIILPSQRIYESRISHPKHFPNGYKFYSPFFAGQLRFKKIYQTPCDIFCKITYLGDPVFNVEQTVNVFDHPTVFIFKRNEH